MRTLKKQQGLTLIELIISIVVIGIALAGVLSVMNFTVSRSADPMIQHQAIAIAEAYLEEILTKSYANQPEPGWPNDNRPNYDDVGDYHGLSHSGARSQTALNSDAPINRLESYTVTVSVSDETLTGGIDAKRIDVGVSHPSGVNITLSGYRADY